MTHICMYTMLVADVSQEWNSGTAMSRQQLDPPLPLSRSAVVRADITNGLAMSPGVSPRNGQTRRTRSADRTGPTVLLDARTGTDGRTDGRTGADELSLFAPPRRNLRLELVGRMRRRRPRRGGGGRSIFLLLLARGGLRSDVDGRRAPALSPMCGLNGGPSRTVARGGGCRYLRTYLHS